MKILLTPILFLTIGATVIGPVTAQTIDNAASSSTAVRGKPTKEQMTGKVMQVNNQAKTFTVTTKGKAVVFSGAKLDKLPKVGEIVDITYTENPEGGPLNSIMLNSSRSNVY